MGKEQLAGESKHGQFNRDQGRQEPSGEDTALMTVCNTSSSAQPESNNCCDYCTSLSHSSEGGGATGNSNSVGPGLSSLFGPVIQMFLTEKQIWSRKTPWEQNREWMRMNNIPSRTPCSNAGQGCFNFVRVLFHQYRNKCPCVIHAVWKWRFGTCRVENKQRCVWATWGSAAISNCDELTRALQLLWMFSCKNQMVITVLYCICHSYCTKLLPAI